MTTSTEWARMENSITCTVGDFVDALPEQEHLPCEQQNYLFDWSLPQYAPSLMEDITIPQYFAGMEYLFSDIWCSYDLYNLLSIVL